VIAIVRMRHYHANSSAARAFIATHFPEYQTKHDLTQIDSSGLGIIVRSYVSLRQKGGDLKLLCPWGRVLQVLAVLRLLNVIPSFEDETQALASFQPYFTSQAAPGSC